MCSLVNDKNNYLMITCYINNKIYQLFCMERSIWGQIVNNNDQIRAPYNNLDTKLEIFLVYKSN